MRLHSFERRYNHDYNTSHLYYDDDVDVRYDVSCYGSLCSNHDYNTSHLYYDDDVDVRYDVSCYGSLCSQSELLFYNLLGNGLF